MSKEGWLLAMERALEWIDDEYLTLQAAGDEGDNDRMLRACKDLKTACEEIEDLLNGILDQGT
jgi:hypothetical protein